MHRFYIGTIQTLKCEGCNEGNALKLKVYMYLKEEANEESVDSFMMSAFNGLDVVVTSFMREARARISSEGVSEAAAGWMWRGFRWALWWNPRWVPVQLWNETWQQQKVWQWRRDSLTGLTMKRFISRLISILSGYKFEVWRPIRGNARRHPAVQPKNEPFTHNPAPIRLRSQVKFLRSPQNYFRASQLKYRNTRNGKETKIFSVATKPTVLGSFSPSSFRV